MKHHALKLDSIAIIGVAPAVEDPEVFGDTFDEIIRGMLRLRKDPHLSSLRLISTKSSGAKQFIDINPVPGGSVNIQIIEESSRKTAST